MFEWDEAKRKSNLKKHGIDFDAVWDFDWHTATLRKNTRADYGEERLLAYGMIGERLYALVYVHRKNAIRIISLRKANTREQRMYEEETKITHH